MWFFQQPSRVCSVFFSICKFSKKRTEIFTRWYFHLHSVRHVVGRRHRHRRTAAPHGGWRETGKDARDRTRRVTTICRRSSPVACTSADGCCIAALRTGARTRGLFADGVRARGATGARPTRPFVFKGPSTCRGGVNVDEGPARGSTSQGCRRGRPKTRARTTAVPRAHCTLYILHRRNTPSLPISEREFRKRVFTSGRTNGPKKTPTTPSAGRGRTPDQKDVDHGSIAPRRFVDVRFPDQIFLCHYLTCN